MKNKSILAWHFVPDTRRLQHPGGNSLEVIAGYTYSESGKIAICESGMHASRRVYDALGFAQGSQLCRVRLYGDVTEHEDKLVARHREVITIRDIASELRLWGCWCIRNTPISGGRTVWDLLTDPSSRNAVEVAERFAAGKATKQELAAARDAARDAAWAAARDAARDAAWAAARDAARDAARAAAWDAAWDAARAAAWAAAWAAARAAARDLHANELERRMVELFA